jgi:hypothetical protein
MAEPLHLFWQSVFISGALSAVEMLLPQKFMRQESKKFSSEQLKLYGGMTFLPSFDVLKTRKIYVIIF